MFCLRRVTPKLLSGVRSCFTNELAAKIRLAGPMSVAQFMQEVLTNPAKGYYTTKEKVIGAPGNFVTSHEISQMFGECIAIWIINEWRKMGSCKPLQLVELGPGHGTLMQDVLRTIQRLVPDEMKHLNVHLVEASQTLIKVQEAKLCGYFHQRPESSEETSTHQAIAKVGLPVKWHSRIGEVPKGFTFFIANEFFDALPVHKFTQEPLSPNRIEEIKANHPSNSNNDMSRQEFKSSARKGNINKDAMSLRAKQYKKWKQINRQTKKYTTYPK